MWSTLPTCLHQENFLEIEIPMKFVAFLLLLLLLLLVVAVVVVVVAIVVVN